MALQKCEECDQEISSKAKVCPHCGCPIKNEDNKNQAHEFEQFLKNEGKNAFNDIINRIKIFLQKDKGIQKVIQKNRMSSKLISLCVGIYFLIASYKPGWFHYERFGDSFLIGPSFNPFSFIIGFDASVKSMFN